MCEVMIARLEADSIAVACFPEQREQDPEQRRKKFLDAGRDHTANAGRGLDVLDPLVEARQRHQRPDAVLLQGAGELVLGVDRVQRRDDGTGR
jgi:hypothetical protein